ncbi:MAG: GNAT family N-acetyltransferase, partial [Rhodocyclaceae bacterium]|nr:GNAT family N-acetyltransferase [Rhodocyclaceae bacterium]
MRLIDCDETQSEAIRGILNESIAHSTAIYDYRPRSRETMSAWFELKRRGGFPIVGAISREGEFMGFGSYGSFRALPAYKYT